MSIQISLQGAWDFCLDPKKQGLDSHFELQSFKDTILLPTTVSEAKKGTPNDKVNTGFLTDPYEMSGYTWYKKEVALPFSSKEELKGKQFELTLERTRISYVWVDGVFAGSFDSLIARHCYDLTGLIRTLNPVITIMVSNTDYKVPGGHLTSPDTQTNWNGILGDITLTIRQGIKIGAVDARCNFKNKTILLQVPVESKREFSLPVRLQIMPVLCHLKDVYAATDKNIPADASFDELVETKELSEEQDFYDVILKPGDNNFSLSLDLSRSGMLWDEEKPYVYRLDICIYTSLEETAPCETASLYTGLRSFTAKGSHFHINGRKTFLRGKHDGMIFPETGYAPMNVAGWLHVMKIAKDFGINHYRFHTCCPPEAAFTAADLLGIYMQPELPFWGTFNGPEDEGYNREAQDFLETEGFRMLESFSNHPSYCMMSMGNELWGNASAINDLLGKYKAFRPHVLFTQGSNNFQWVPNIQPHDDFFSGVRFTPDRQLRGSYATCDKPLGHIQSSAPNTRFNYDEAVRPSYTSSAPEVSEDGTIEIQYGTGVKRVKLTEAQAELVPEIPVVSHEIGQYETYPDFREIDRYTGVLKARNLEEFKRRLKEKGMLGFSDDYFRNSGALAVACYKDELETALRSSRMGGFQILDLQDFTGQGTALVGVLNSFMENKGLISAGDFRKFCSDAVIQAEFDSYVAVSGQDFSFTVSLSYFRKEALPETKLFCKLTNSDNRILNQLTSPVNAVTENGRQLFGDFTFKLPETKLPCRLTLTVSLEDTDIENAYQLWLYPEYNASALSDTSRNIAHRFGELSALAGENKSCIFFLSDEENKSSIPGIYCTDFWCYHMFRSISLSMKKEVPVGTMGLLIRREHEALASFPTETFSTPQWYSLVTASRSTVLDGTELVPIVQTIDNFDRNFRLGLLYEIYLSDLDLGVLVCTSDLPGLIQEGHAEAAALYESLTAYLPRLAENRTSAYTMTSEQFKALLNADVKEPDWD